MAERTTQSDVLELTEVLAEEGYRLTHPRLSVFRVLVKTKEHLSADDIYTHMHGQGDWTSRASIYRALKLLENKGLVRRVPVKQGPCLYECVRSPRGREQVRCHFVCRQCGQVKDIEAPEMENLVRALRKPLSIAVDDYEIRLVGTCERCRPVRQAHHRRESRNDNQQ